MDVSKELIRSIVEKVLAESAGTAAPAEPYGNVLTAKPGEIIYIPKGSHIHFQTPNYAKYWYFVYPANWAEL